MLRMQRKQATLSEQLRDAINACELSCYRISQETGIAEATLSRFMAGKGGLSTKGQDDIGLLLGLKLITERKPRAAMRPTRRRSKGA